MGGKCPHCEFFTFDRDVWERHVDSCSEAPSE